MGPVVLSLKEIREMAPSEIRSHGELISRSLRALAGEVKPVETPELELKTLDDVKRLSKEQMKTHLPLVNEFMRKLSARV